ncbi:zinc finger protein 3 homolog [Malaya genurostris]|uniref:zinc finger protein 3 homolog n=1 Tax=Malaya genurostris TaxID=325434 RepID=UPI0026F38B0A|nr:zinc finger protein 3 homolog [Malaya genurostris]
MESDAIQIVRNRMVRSVRLNTGRCVIPGCSASAGCVGWNNVVFFDMSFGDLPHWWDSTTWAAEHKTELPMNAKICEMHFEERFIDRSKKKARLMVGTIPTLQLPEVVEQENKSETDEHICQFCPKAFQTIDSYEIHLEKHSQILRYECHMCSEVYNTSANLILHQLKNHAQNDNYTTKSWIEHYTVLNRSPMHLKCNYCDLYEANNMSTMISHLKCHVQEYECDQCQKKFSTATRLRKHLATHKLGKKRKNAKAKDSHPECTRELRKRSKRRKPYPKVPIRQSADHCFIPGCSAYVGWNDVAFFNMSFGDLPHWWRGTAWAAKYKTELPMNAKICEMHFEERFIDRSKKKPRLIMGTIPTLQLALLEQVIEEENKPEPKEYFCRLCAKRSVTKFNGRLDQLPGLEEVTECCMGKYKNQLGLPLGVCDHCIQIMKQFANFVKKCEQSQKQLLLRFNVNSKNDTVKEPTSKNKASRTTPLNSTGKKKPSRRDLLEQSNSDDSEDLLSSPTEQGEVNSEWRTCLDCGRIFKDLANYHRHVKTHNDSENGYVCQICDKRFQSTNDLRYHLDLVHDEKRSKRPARELETDTESNEHKCFRCDKVFSSPANLKVHILAHSDTKIICDICGSAFRTKQMHMQHLIQAHSLEFNENEQSGTPRKRLRKGGIQLIQLCD